VSHWHLLPGRDLQMAAGDQMYVRIASMVALLCASNLSMSVATAAPAPSATAGTCSSLATDYDGIEKSLASNYAEGIGDNSAPRETYRQIKNSNDLARASMVLTLMQAHHCSLPDHAPSMVRYLSAALSCATDRLKSTSESASCKMETWQPLSPGEGNPSSK
jgi:hypothetical protein